MATAGPNGPSSASNLNTGGSPWANPGNVTAEDGSVATCQGELIITDGFGDELEAIGFGFSIPGGSTIDGILVEPKMSCTNDTNTFDTWNCQLITGGATEGSAKTTACILTTILVFQTAGGAADLWSGTWTTAKVNAADFGVRIKMHSSSSNSTTANIDYIKITITYTGAAGGTSRSVAIVC